MRASHGWRRWMRRTLKTILVLVLVIVVVTGGYIGFVAVRHVQPVTLLAPTGPYQVGRAMFDWTDHARVDPLAPRAGILRELSVWMWYPASPHAHSRPTPYAPGVWGQLHFGGLPGLGESSFGGIGDHSLDGVPVASGRFPIVVLEPGMGFSAPQYTAIAENLASNGYLVAGVTPTYSANLTVLHGRAVHATAAGNPEDLGGHTGQAAAEGDRLINVWAADARFTAAQVAGLDRTESFVGHIEPTHTVYIGHSFGGAASLQACYVDPQCAGAVDMDGTQFGSVVHAGLKTPMMILGHQNSCVTGTCRPANADDHTDIATARSLLASSAGPTWCYSIDGTGHFNFSDYAVYYLAAPLRHVLALGSIDGSIGLAITNTYLTAFLDRTVHVRAEPLLTGTSKPYSQVRAQCLPR